MSKFLENRSHDALIRGMNETVTENNRITSLLMGKMRDMCNIASESACYGWDNSYIKKSLRSTWMDDEGTFRCPIGENSQ